jgi:hypothetical protein
MPSTVQELASWAHGLRLDSVPDGVQARARLQHLSAAGACRALGLEGPDRSPNAAAVCRALDAVGLNDTIFVGHSVAASAATGWDFADSASVSDLLRATIAGNEVGARVGASRLLGDAAQASVSAACAAITAGVLAGDGPDVLGSSLAAALHGGADILNDGSDFFGGAAGGPRLPAAFTGLGQAWLSQTLAFGVTPGRPAVATAVEGVHEILRRHVKAADKRLRVDQLERVEIIAAAPIPGFASAAPPTDSAWSAVSVATNARQAIGLLVSAYEFGPAQLAEGPLADSQASATSIAGRVHVVTDWGRSATAVAHMLETAAPLFAGVAPSALARWWLRGRPEGGLGGSGDGAAVALRQVLGARPDRVLRALARAKPDLGTARLESWQPRTDTLIRLHTTRGGTWPERRTVPEGAPGWPWQDTMDRVLGRHGGRGQALFEIAMDADAGEWVAALRG